MPDFNNVNILKLKFEVLKNINDLPLYHGAHFYAFFKNIIKDNTFYTTSSIIPFTQGLTNLQRKEFFHCLILTYSKTDSFDTIVENLNKNIIDDKYKFSSSSLKLIDYETISTETLYENEYNKLSNLDKITLSFFTPLRLKRPVGAKSISHTFVDLDYFYSNQNCIEHLLKNFRMLQKPVIPLNKLHIANSYGLWLDVPYGNDKTLGGFIGDIEITGEFTREILTAIIVSQYFGIGKNRAFGFGYYFIKESENIFTKIFQSKNHIYNRISLYQNLKSSLFSLKHTAPGIDNIEINDVISGNVDILNKIRSLLNEGTYNFNKLKTVSIKKDDGGFRELRIPVVLDRIVEKSIMNEIEPSIDKHLSIAVYSYRKHFGVKRAVNFVKKSLSKGYIFSLRTDITKYFDSISTIDLLRNIDIFFREEKLTEIINKWLQNLNKEGVSGIAQGSPLSPLLSNFYLDYFDKEIIKKGVILIRFADDFLIMMKEHNFEDMLQLIKEKLSYLKLQLNEDKIKFFKEDAPIEFLGHSITVEGAKKIEAPDTTEEFIWNKIFDPTFYDGIPVYITRKDCGVYSDNANIVIKRDKKENLEKIPWQMVRDITLVGRVYFSYGVTYRALYENIPIHFVNIFGKYIGSIQSDVAPAESFKDKQKQFLLSQEKVLTFSKEIISAKINNSYTILKRNGIASKELKDLINKVKYCNNLEALRGYEGTAAKIYFGHFKKLVEPFEFAGREYYPPVDEVNAMLSFSYTLIYYRVAFVLRKKGFDPYLGLFHRGRGNHFALASDCMEELRHIGERLVLNIIHKKILTPNDFVKKEGRKGVYLSSDGFVIFLNNFEESFRKRTSYSGQNLSYYEYIDEIGNKLRRLLNMDIPYRALRIR